VERDSRLPNAQSLGDLSLRKTLVE